MIHRDGLRSLIWPAALLTVAGCAISVQRNDWTAYSGPGAEYFQKPEYELPIVADPLEPLNRVLAGMNEAAIIWVVDPVSAGWRFLTPQPVRDGLVRAADNLEYPRRAVNHLLQGQTERAGTESQRFLTNSTVGVLGFLDPAADKGINRADTDTGTTLDRWGWRESMYTTIPFGFPGTVRDVVGSAGDGLLDPTVYFFPAYPIKGFIVGSERADDYKRFVTTNADPYDRLKLMWTARRRIIETRFPSEPDDSGASQTVRGATLALVDPWFPYRVQTRSVRIPSTGRRLPYNLWMQPEPAPLAFVLPGLSGHRGSTSVLFLAEMLFEDGFSVASISAAMNFEFMKNAATVPVPGFAPADARDVHAALDAVWHDAKDEYGERIFGRALVGMSVGGTHALYIAADGAGDLVDFDAYLAIGPPVQLGYAAEKVDALYNVPLRFPEDERDDRVLYILQKGMRLGFEDRNTDPESGLSREEAEFLIGLSYRLTLHDAILLSQERHDMGVLKTPIKPLQRASASREILDFSMMEYAYAFLLPYFSSRDDDVTTAEGLFTRADLRSCAEGLHAKEKARVVSSANDVMLAPEDLTWLGDVFGRDRLVIHPDGGHLGNLDDPAVRESILRLLNAPGRAR